MCQICGLVFTSYEDGTSRNTAFQPPWMANHLINRRGRPTLEGTQQNGHRFCLRVEVEGPHKQ